MDDNSTMPYGVHVGEKMANVPAAYLRWLYENDKCSSEVKKYIENNAELIKITIKNPNNGNTKK